MRWLAWLLVICYLLFVSSCGVFRSSVDRSVDTDSAVTVERVADLSELEELSADIPAYFIDYIELSSGLKIQLRDSVSVGSGGRQVAGPSISDQDSTDPALRMTEDGASDSAEGGISINYRRDRSERDSVVSESRVESEESVKKETEVETSLGWILWLLVGLVVGLAAVLAGFLFLRR